MAGAPNLQRKKRRSTEAPHAEAKWASWMARRALIIAMIVLAASTSHAIANGQQIMCQLSGVVIFRDSPGQRVNKSFLFQIDDSGGQLISGIDGVLATTMDYQATKIEGRLRDVALTVDAAPSLFGKVLDGLNASQSNFFLDRVSGNAVLSATFLSNAAIFAIGPCRRTGQPRTRFQG
jgi:hypothetical protein